MNEIKVRNFKEIPYEELEQLNLAAKRKMADRIDPEVLKEHYLKYLTDETQLKAVTVCFSDLEGRFHMLDYDKKFLIRSYENLTFDGSSIRGFSEQRESDLRLGVDWGTFRWLPSDVFGPGKVLIFGSIRDKDGLLYDADLRGALKCYADALFERKRWIANVAVEIEGFLFDGQNAEQNFDSKVGFQFVSDGGYFNALPTAPLKMFIDRFAEAQRALGFENEKDHPEVAPSQFELNYGYCDALIAADQIQVYKLLARQIAAQMGYTACFLPKPRMNVNGSGMHTNLSVSEGGRNLFFEKGGRDGLSPLAWQFIDRVLHSAEGLCLVLNPSVNAYRRLDPHFEAPNQIRASAVDRAAMVRIPIGNERSARIEVRSIAPDANPYLTVLALIRTGLEGPCAAGDAAAAQRDRRDRVLSSHIQDALARFGECAWLRELMGAQNHRKYGELKTGAADRCPKELGTRIKTAEIIYHHEITNQHLWNIF